MEQMEAVGFACVKFQEHAEFTIYIHRIPFHLTVSTNSRMITVSNKVGHKMDLTKFLVQLQAISSDMQTHCYASFKTLSWAKPIEIQVRSVVSFFADSACRI